MASTDTIYIESLPQDVTEDDLSQYFGRIGIIRTEKKTRRPKIWIYKDPETGLPKGDATVSYEDPHAAVSAVEWFHQKQLKGTVIHVSLAKGVETALASQNSAPVQPPVVQSFASNQDYRGQWHKGIDNGRNRNKKVVAAPQGPQRLFGPDDWPCPSCGNTNWARRPRCNLCGAPKPGTSDMKREGQAGGFKELDQAEIAEARLRRKALEEADDGELYDDYGRIKKKYRGVVDRATREEAALARLRGDYDPSPSAQEYAHLFHPKDPSPSPQEEIQTNPTKKRERTRSTSPDRKPSTRGKSPSKSSRRTREKTGRSKH